MCRDRYLLCNIISFRFIVNLSFKFQIFSYDPMVNRWREGPALNVPRRDFGFIFDGRCLLAIGGEGNGRRLFVICPFIIEILKFCNIKKIILKSNLVLSLTALKCLTQLKSMLNGQCQDGCHTFLDESKCSLYRNNFKFGEYI